ncbi:MAG: hypothetical protein NVSMB16_02780 [Acidimicrobiales bacterium]
MTPAYSGRDEMPVGCLVRLGVDADGQAPTGIRYGRTAPPKRCNKGAQTHAASGISATMTVVAWSRR